METIKEAIMLGITVAALFFSLLTSAFYFLQKKVPNIVTRMFKVVVVTSLLNLSFDFFSYIYGRYIPAVKFMSTIVCLGYAVTAIMAWHLLLIYNYIIISGGKNRISFQFIYTSSVPSSLSIITLVIWTFTNNLISDQPGAIGITKDVYGLIVINYIWYTALNIGIMIYFRKESNKKAMIITLMGIVEGVMLIVIAQTYQILAESVFLAIDIMYLYIIVQRPKNHVDPELKCFERRSFNEMVESYEALSNNYYIFTISLINSNHYMAKYGQKITDAILKRISDFLPKDSFAVTKYRYNNNTFALLTTEEKEYNALVERWKKTLQTSWYIENNKIEIGFEVFYYFRKQEDGKMDVVDKIGRAMSFAHRKQVESIVDMSDIFSEVDRYESILNSVRKAIRNESFQVAYQPIYNTKKKNYDKVEVLARLFDEKEGVISPSEFIPIAEENDIISDVTKIIVKKALENYKNNIGLLGDMTNISINLSSIEIGNYEMFIYIRNLVRNMGLNPESIIFEITETADIEDFDSYCNNINQFIDYGFKLSLDDYGTGYSSLERILSLPFEYIKIDRTLLNLASVNMKKRILLEKTIDMFKACGYKLVIEGVEDKVQVDALEDIGVDYIQGFYYSKPLSIEELTNFVKIEGHR